jgi:hypothetical protein
MDEPARCAGAPRAAWPPRAPRGLEVAEDFLVCG